MIAVIQRVSSASVYIDSIRYSGIQSGLVCLLGVQKGDTKDQVGSLMQKIANLRIFADENGKMNHSLLDKSFEILIVSQFTLAGSCKKGNRPSFTDAELPEKAEALYLHAIEVANNLGLRSESGCFGADMKINLTNDGPVTFILEA